MEPILQPFNLASPISRSRAINGDFAHSYLKQTQIQQLRESFARNFANSPDYMPASEARVNGEPRRLIVAKHKSELTQKDVIAYPGEDIGIGDIVECYGAHWLVTQKDPNTDIFSRGLMELCSTTLRWQNPQTLEIVERWVYVKNPYSTNIRESSTLTTLNGKYEVYITKDDETLAVAPDKRFIMGMAGGKPLAYKLTFPDIHAETFDGQGQGIIVWNLVSDEDIRPEDNLELMIADYVTPTQSTNPPGQTPFYTAIIRGGNTIIVGYSKTFACDFYYGMDVLQDPNEITNITWSVDCDDILKPYISLEPNLNECRVVIEDNDDAINRKFKLSCQADRSDIGTFEVECVVM